MKRHVLTILALAGSWGPGLMAQTCTANSSFPPVAPSPPAVINGDSCTATNQLNFSCSDANSIGSAPDFIYSFSMPSGLYVANLSPTGWDAYLAVMAGTCASTSICPQESENGGIGVTETVALTGLPPGDYFLLISSFAGASNCGAYALSLQFTPVALQSFSID